MTGVAQLGYLVFEARDLEAWHRFGTGVLGMAVVDAGTDGFKLRMDGHRQRFVLTQGERDDLSAVGWELPDAGALQALVTRLRARGHEVTEADARSCESRRVERLFRMRDPDGIGTELYSGPTLAEGPYVSTLVRSGFVADGLGLGHVVLSCNDAARSAEFYTSELGFSLSDRIRCDLQGFAVDVHFYHCNARHHSLALGGPQHKRLHHFMIEVHDLDDVGMAFDRARAAGVRIAQTVGRHPNDRMVSFYALTPSGFQFEFGWGGRLVDDATWETTEYDRISDWGHTPPKQLLARSKEGDHV